VQQKNPWALRDMAERLLEAHQRGMWENVDQAMLDQLRSLSLEAEAEIEGRLGKYGWIVRQLVFCKLYWYVSDQLTGDYQPIDSQNFVVSGSEKQVCMAPIYCKLRQIPKSISPRVGITDCIL